MRLASFKKPNGIITLAVFLLLAFVTSSHAQVMDSTWFRPRQLINHPMTAITGVTLKGEKVDSNFFKGNVSVLAFGNLINVASLKEIEALNRLQQDFAGHKFKILSVMPNARQDVKDFNDPDDNNDGMGHSLRMSFQLPIMEYSVLPTCDKRNSDNTLHPACDNVVKDYLIGGYPVLCIVDKNGIVRYVHVGLPSKEEMDKWYGVVTNQVNVLLKEQ